MWKRILVAVIVSFSGGAVVGWHEFGKRSLDAPVTKQVPVGPAPLAAEPWSVLQFDEALRAHEEERKREGFNPISKHLKNWTNEDLRLNLEECLRDPGFMLRESAGEGIGTMLLAEWLRRDVKASVMWFDHLESPAMKGNLADGLMKLWPREHAEEGRVFFFANRLLFPQEGPFPEFIQQNVR